LVRRLGAARAAGLPLVAIPLARNRVNSGQCLSFPLPLLRALAEEKLVPVGDAFPAHYAAAFHAPCHCIASACLFCVNR